MIWERIASRDSKIGCSTQRSWPTPRVRGYRTAFYDGACRARPQNVEDKWDEISFTQAIGESHEALFLNRTGAHLIECRVESRQVVCFFSQTLARRLHPSITLLATCTSEVSLIVSHGTGL